MTPTTRKRLLIGGGGIVALLVAVVVAAPALIDINSYKPLIVSQVKTATGRDLVIDGPISLSLLPTPTVSVTGVKFFNAAGSKNANMVEVKSVTVQPSLLPLLVGRIEVGEVTLVEPKIVLEINAAGKPNWEFAPSVAEAKPAAAKPSSPRPLSLGRLTIDNGTLIFSDSKAGLSVVGEKANFSASVGSIDGPYTLAGGATVNGAPLKLDLAVGARGANGHSADVTLQAGGGKLGFKGTLSELGAAAKVSGIASVSADSLTTFVGTLVKLSGQPEPPLPPLLAGKFTFDGAIDVSQTAFAARDFKMALGQDSGSGTLAVTLKPKLGVEGKLSVPKLDLDRWLAALQQPSSPATSPAPQAAPAAPGNTNASGGGFFGDLNAKLALGIGEVIYNKQPVRSVALELEAKGGAVAVPKLAATLPGDMVLQAQSTLTGDAARPGVTGQFSLVGPKLRETLAWLAVDVSSVPPSKLQRLSLRGRMSSTGGNVQVSDAVFELDDLKGSGGVTVTFGVPLSIVTSVSLDTLDLDSFLVKTPAQQKPATPSSAATGPASAPAVAGPSVGLKARVARLIYNKETIQGVDVDVALQGNTLRLNDIKISNLGGGRLAVRGSVANYSAPMPRPGHRLQLRGTRSQPRAEGRGHHRAIGPRRGERQRRHRRHDRAAHPARRRREHGWPEREGDRHPVAAGRLQGCAAIGGLQGQPGTERPGARRLDRCPADRPDDRQCRPARHPRSISTGSAGAVAAERPARPAGRGQAAAAKPIDTRAAAQHGRLAEAGRRHIDQCADAHRQRRARGKRSRTAS